MSAANGNQLMKAYNINIMHTFRTLYQSFRDVPGLKTELARFLKLLKQDEKTLAIYQEFNADTRAYEDDIFTEKKACLAKINILNRMEMPAIYERMTTEETKVFWKRLIQIVRYHGLLNACGDHVNTMENLGMEFVQKHQGMSPDQIQKAMVQEMLTDGKMMEQMIGMFQKPGAIENIIKNIGPLLRGQGQDAIDLMPLLKEIQPEDVANLGTDIKQMQSEMKAKGGMGDMMNFAQLFNMSKPATESEPVMLEPNGEVYSMLSKFKEQIEREKQTKE